MNFFIQKDALSFEICDCSLSHNFDETILTSGQTEFGEEIGIINIKICTLSGALGV